MIEPLTDYSSIPRHILDAAADRGTAVHLATELYDRDDLDEDSLDELLVPYLAGWKLFLRDTQFAPEFIEYRVWHKTHFYAGTIDRIGLLNGERWVLDIKSTALLYPAMGVQAAAYQEAHNSHVKKTDRITRRGIVQLKDDGTYHFQEYDDKTDFSVFLSYLNLHNWRAKHAA